MNRRKAVAAIAGIFGALSLKGSAQQQRDPIGADPDTHRHQWEHTWLSLVGWLKDPGTQYEGGTTSEMATTEIKAPQAYHPEPGMVSRCSICGVLSIQVGGK